jgi:hypothetical protein
MVVLGTVGAIPASGHQQAPMPSKIVQAEHHKATSSLPRRLAARIAAAKSFSPMRRSMRALSSAGLSWSRNASSVAVSISADSSAARHTARTSRPAFT